MKLKTFLFFLILNCLFSTNHIHLCIFVDVSGIYLHCIQNSLWDSFFFGTAEGKMLHKNSKMFHFTLLLLWYRFIYSTQEIWLKFENYINTTRKPRNNTIICQIICLALAIYELLGMEVHYGLFVLVVHVNSNEYQIVWPCRCVVCSELIL